MDQARIGAFIRSVRKESGLTQEQLAERLGVSQRSVSRWETGRTMPDYSLLPALCEALGINVAELLGAERIAGDSVPKKQVTAAARSLIALMGVRKRRLLGAVLSAVLTLACMAALYSYEFSVSVASTADLERAIDAYHFADETSADVLERQALGSRLYVLYGENEYPGACGLACLERGLFGKYRIVSCEDTSFRWINARKIKAGRTTYCVTFCVNDLPGIDAYGVCEPREEPDLPADELLFRLDYRGPPFLTFTEIAEDAAVSALSVRYFRNGELLPYDEQERVLGPYAAEGAPNAGTGTAELGMIYVLEGILLLLGIVFVRYFLTDDGK